MVLALIGSQCISAECEDDMKCGLSLETLRQDELQCFEPSEACLEGTVEIWRGGNYSSLVGKEQKLRWLKHRGNGVSV